MSGECSEVNIRNGSTVRSLSRLDCDESEDTTDPDWANVELDIDESKGIDASGSGVDVEEV